MVNLDNILTFELNILTYKIESSNNDDIVGKDFATFYNEVINEKVLGEIVEKIDYVTFESLVTTNNEESMVFHVKNSPVFYHFIKTAKKNDKVLCILEKRYLADTLSSSSNLDYLSGVYSRSYLISSIAKSILDPNTKDFYFFIIDINDFKHINDNYGHSVGDESLRKFAQTLLKMCGDSILGRFGGDEFILFCPNISHEQMTELAQNIINLNVTLDKKKTKVNVNCCLGVTYSQDKQATFDFLLERADKALYRSKEGGKHIAYFDNECIAKVSKKMSRKSNVSVLQNRHSALFKEELNARRIKYVSLVVIIALLCFVFFEVFLMFMGRRIEEDTKNEVNHIIGTVSGQIDNNLKMSIRTINHQLIQANEEINAFEKIEGNENEISSILNSISTDLFYRLAIVTKDRCYYYVEESGLDKREIKDAALFNDLKEGKQPFYAKSFNGERNGTQVVFMMPFNHVDDNMSEVIGICGFLDSSKFEPYINTSVFDEKTFVSFVKSDGTIISSTGENVKNKINLDEYFREIGVEKSNREHVIKAVKDGSSSGIFTINVNGVEKYVSVDRFIFDENSPDLDSQFRLIVTVPSKAVLKEIKQTVAVINVIFNTSLIVLVVALVVVLFFDYRHKKQFFLIQNIDGRTQGLNYSRFKQDVQTMIYSGKRFSYVYVYCMNFGMMFNNEEEKRDDLLHFINSLIGSKLKDNETVARVYIDRFAFVVNNDENHRTRISQIIDAINEGVFAKYNERIKAIAGVYENRPIDTSSIEYCIDMAGLALRKAISENKESGVTYYTDKMLIYSINEKTMENKARVSLGKNEFIIYYQAQRDILRDKWVSAEALVRWKDPVEGLIFPDKFIPLFERDGFIVDLDIYVFEKVCEFIDRNIKNNRKVLPISVNISKKTLETPNTLERYKKILGKYTFPRNLIIFELTESIMVENKKLLHKVIEDIDHIGCGCAVDDFGTGYSSLSFITNYDFDEIKLDKSFFEKEKFSSEKGKIVVDTVVGLCKNLNVRVVAEGVENMQCVEYLRKIGCECIQGYVFSKPLEEKDFIRLVAKDEIQ